MRSLWAHLFWSWVEAVWMGPPTLSSKLFSAWHVFLKAHTNAGLSAVGVAPNRTVPRSKLLINWHTHTNTCTVFGLRAWQMHAVIMTPTMDERTRKRIRQTKTHWDGLKGKRSANGSKKKRKKAPQPFLSAYNTPLRPAFLVAHLRKTSVPPHDAELRVSFCL